jgi:cysteinyl-tRNA synthetase
MAHELLGESFDIHGGGNDLMFPHHENEIAQSCCAHGHENDLSAFAKVWVHNGFVTADGEKMSKSIGNIRLVHDLLKTWPGEVLRYALLSAQYRQPLDWSEKTLEQARQNLDRLYTVLHELADIKADIAGCPADVMGALLDDLNTPMAFAALNAVSRKGSKEEIKAGLLAAGKILGILQQHPAGWLGYGQAGDDGDAAAIDALLAERQDARRQKNFARADAIRAELAAKGIVIEDTAAGPKWKKA